MEGHQALTRWGDGHGTDGRAQGSNREAVVGQVPGGVVICVAGGRVENGLGVVRREDHAPEHFV